MKFNAFLLCFFWGIILNQKINALGCRVDFQIKGLEGKRIVFACEYGEKQIVVDSVSLDNYGKGFYESKERLIGGIYVVVFPNSKFLEVLINDEQFFTIQSDTSNTLGNTFIEGNDEGAKFLKYQQFTQKLQQSTQEKSDLKNQLDSFKNDILQHDPRSFLASYLKMQQDPNLLPVDTKEPKQAKEQFIARRSYLKNHYFDNIDFTDKRILRTRLLFEKLSFYFNVIISQQADSIIHEMDQLISSNVKNTETYRYLLNFFLVNYRAPKQANQEKVFVYIADNYYLNGKNNWSDPRFIKLLQERVDAMRSNILGAKAPNLALQSLENETITLEKIQTNYLLVFFFANDCNSCKKEAQQLDSVFRKYKEKGLEVLAVYVHADKAGLNDFISQTGYNWHFAYDPLLKSNFSKLYNVKETPTLYLLDKNKAILKKNFKAKTLSLD